MHRAALVTAAALLLYGGTLSPTVNSFDSAEYVTGAYTLGIVHATGYPLYLLIGHVAAHLPVGSPALNVNVLSAIYGALACGVLTATSHRITGRAAPAVMAGLLAAVSGSIWSQAVVAEVYTLAALLLAVLIAVVWGWLAGDVPLWAVGLVAGLNLTNHMASVLFLPGLGMVIAGELLRRYPLQFDDTLSNAPHRYGLLRSLPFFRGGETKEGVMRELLLALIAFLLPLTLYAYLPIRYAADPPLNVVGDYFTIPLTTPSGLWWMITGGMFRQAMFSAGVVNIGRLAGALWLDLLGVGLLLALIGALRLPQRAFTAFLVMGSISVVVFFGLYDVIDTRTMIIPALVGLIPLVAVGLHEIEQHVGQRIVWGAGAVVIGVGVMVTWGYADRSGDTLAYAFAAEVMQTAEPDALLIAQWTGATPLTYMQVVEGRRPDVTVFDRGLFALGLRDTLVRQGITAEERIDALTLAAYYAVVEEALAAGRPVYVMEEDLVLLQRYCLEPVGVMYRVGRCDWY